MFRTVINFAIRNPAIRTSLLRQPAAKITPRCVSATLNNNVQQIRTYSLLSSSPNQLLAGIRLTEFLRTSPTAPQQYQPSRAVTKFSLKKGKRKTVKAVVRRFKRLDWGGWIRTHSGRNKKMWKKTGKLKRRLRQHIFVNATQSWLLDKMVTKFWRRPKNYVDDPYKPYHTREEFYVTAKKPAN